MLSDIQAMIVDYKKKSQYSNLISKGGGEGGGDEAHEDRRQMMAVPTHTVTTLKSPADEHHGHDMVPQSRLTYRTGDSFDVSVTSRSHSRSRSRDMSKSQS